MKDATDVTVILDRSGSMEAIRSDVIGGFNQFLTDQLREPGECSLTLVQFDTQYEVVYAARPIADAPRLSDSSFQPRGSTALLDAIGRTIDSTVARLAALPESERPARVLLVIITDGLENASTDYKREQVFGLISTQRDVHLWSFLFLAANQDAIAEGGKLGIAAQQSVNFVASAAGIRNASQIMSASVSALRSSKSSESSETPTHKKGKVH